MHEPGKVVEIKGKNAVVEFTRTGQCKHCGACMTAGEREMRIEVVNTLGVEPGAVVGVEMPEKSFMKATFLMYVVPLLALIAALFVAAAFTDNELIMVLVGIVCAAGAFGLLRLLEPKFKRSGNFKPRMVEYEEGTTVRENKENENK